ncbi:hypothetical protein [Streptomyces fradiae]|uniref:hypothetical protein n=1 Tax=Streptomyces fradiae TaxID=1906 RepID=UPI003987CEFD
MTPGAASSGRPPTGRATRGAGFADGADGAAYPASRVPSQYSQRSCSASYSHIASPSTTTPIRSPPAARRKPSPSVRPAARSSAARRYRPSAASARASSGTGSAARAMSRPAPGGSCGTETRSRPSTHADQPFEHSTRAQSPSRSSSRTGRSGSSGTVGLAVPGDSHAGMPCLGTTCVGRKSSTSTSPSGTAEPMEAPTFA